MSNVLPGNLHAEIAAIRLGGVHEWQVEEGSTDATNIAAALDAMTNATLALAYEQRTASLIALATTDPSFYGSTGPSAWVEIEARLGREVTK